MSEAGASAQIVNQCGQCNCGKVKYEINAPLRFAGFCHCKACSRAMGMSPVHLVMFNGDDCLKVTAGKDSLREVAGRGKMRHAFCGDCGSGLWQHPEGADFRAVFPVNFQIEDAEGPGCKLPSMYLPQLHVNYENRLMDSADSLPKCKVWPGGEMLNNDGTPLA